MENQRSIAIVIAFVAAVLVVLAGKSCASSIDNQNKQGNSGSGGQLSYTSINIGGEPDNAQNNGGGNQSGGNDTQSHDGNQIHEIQYVTDLLGRVVGTVAPEDVTRYYIEDVTNRLGNVIGTEIHIVTEGTTEPVTHVEYVTDLLGRVKGTEYVDGPAPNPPATQAPTSAPETEETTAKKPSGGSHSQPGTVYIVIN